MIDSADIVVSFCPDEHADVQLGSPPMVLVPD
ncbi:MAG: hypothetical protein ACJAZ8_000733 [Planctomycetota bacterium]|jgi:hypothetical protein